MRVLSPDQIVGLTVRTHRGRGVVVARVIDERGVISWVIVSHSDLIGPYLATADQIRA